MITPVAVAVGSGSDRRIEQASVLWGVAKVYVVTAVASLEYEVLFFPLSIGGVWLPLVVSATSYLSHCQASVK